MKIAFLGRGLEVASTRYRIVIPAYQLQKMGHEITKDAPILVFNKGSIDPEVLKLYPKTVYDICDDNFDCPMRGPEYRAHTARANVVTVNSECMRFSVHQKTGKVCGSLSPTPTSMTSGHRVGVKERLWFGHWTNLKDLDRCGVSATVLTAGAPEGSRASGILSRMPHETWSPEAMDRAFRTHAIVFIPTGRAIAKSANRLIESVRAGNFVVAEPLPAYEEFSRWMWVGDMKEGVKWAESDKDECLERVKACQLYIREKYSPERIGVMWNES